MGVGTAMVTTNGDNTVTTLAPLGRYHLDQLLLTEADMPTPIVVSFSTLQASRPNPIRSPTRCAPTRSDPIRPDPIRPENRPVPAPGPLLPEPQARLCPSLRPAPVRASGLPLPEPTFTLLFGMPQGDATPSIAETRLWPTTCEQSVTAFVLFGFPPVFPLRVLVTHILQPHSYLSSRHQFLPTPPPTPHPQPHFHTAPPITPLLPLQSPCPSPSPPLGPSSGWGWRR